MGMLVLPRMLCRASIGSVAKGDKNNKNLPLAFIFLRYYAKGIKVVLVLIA